LEGWVTGVPTVTVRFSVPVFPLGPVRVALR
jgi:hypothetical protein